MDFKSSLNKVTEPEDFRSEVTSPSPRCFSLKRVLFCCAVLFFALAASAGAQVTCPGPPNDKQLLLDIKNTLDNDGVLNWSSTLSTGQWDGDFEPQQFQRHYTSHRSNYLR